MTDLTAAATTTAPRPAAGLSVQYATFFVNGLYFGVEVLTVQEVIRYQQMTRVPLAPPVVSGLINLRGQIVTAIDVRTRLGMEPRTGDRLPMNVVVRTDDGVTSLLVDEIGDVVEVQASQFEPTPDTMRGVARDLVDGIYKLDSRLLLVLNVARAVTIAPVESPLQTGGR
jgi:purine-binding chemotaxis protein CheW